MTWLIPTILRALGMGGGSGGTPQPVTLAALELRGDNTLANLELRP